jgi:CBS domain-containing protein
MCSRIVSLPFVWKEVFSVFHRLLVVINGQSGSLQAAQAAIETATLLQAELHLLSIEVLLHDDRATQAESSRQRLSSVTSFNHLQAPIRQWAEQQGILTRSVIRSGPDEAQIILNYSQESHCDLIVLGATGNVSRLSATVSETARRVANSATCAVLLVRSPTNQHQVHDIMTKEAPRVTPQAPLREVVNALIEGGIKLLTVVNDDQQVLGVITLGYLFTHDETFRRLDLRQATSTASLEHYVHQLFTTQKTAGEVMHRHPLVVRDDMPLSVAAQRMISHKITRMPVVTSEGRVVGVLDQAQLLRYYSDLPDSPGRGSAGVCVQRVVPLRTVGEAALSQVPLIPLGTDLPETLHCVQETPLRRVIVIDNEGKAVGVIADSDILVARGLAGRRNPLVALAGRFQLHLPEDLFRRRSSSGPLSAQQIMRPQLFAVTPTTSVADVKAVRLMLMHHIKRLVVVDDAGKPLGLVDRQQLLRSLLKGDLLP